MCWPLTTVQPLTVGTAAAGRVVKKTELSWGGWLFSSKVPENIADSIVLAAVEYETPGLHK